MASLASGKPRELFLDNVRTQGGDVECLISLRGKYRSSHSFELRSPAAGWIQTFDAFKIGLASVHLGVGRNTATDSVAPDVGLLFSKKAGERVEAGDLVATLWGRNAANLQAARPLAEAALVLGPETPPRRRLIIKEIAST